MKTITDFLVLTSIKSNDIEDMVNEHLKAGWQPFGNLVISSDENSDLFAQAMVKYEEKEYSCD